MSAGAERYTTFLPHFHALRETILREDAGGPRHAEMFWHASVEQWLINKPFGSQAWFGVVSRPMWRWLDSSLWLPSTETAGTRKALFHHIRQAGHAWADRRHNHHHQADPRAGARLLRYQMFVCALQEYGRELARRDRVEAVEMGCAVARRMAPVIRPPGRPQERMLDGVWKARAARMGLTADSAKTL